MRIKRRDSTCLKMTEGERPQRKEQEKKGKNSNCHGEWNVNIEYLARLCSMVRIRLTFIALLIRLCTSIDKVSRVGLVELPGMVTLKTGLNVGSGLRRLSDPRSYL